MLNLSIGCDRVDRSLFPTIPTPPATGRHRPVPHHVLVDTITTAASDRGLAIRDEQWGLSHQGQRLYGAVDFHVPAWIDMPGGIGASIGVRHANDRSMSVQIVAGARVFVCQNGCFVGDLRALRGRHTTGLDLAGLVGRCLDEYLDRLCEFRALHSRLAEAQITNLRAKALIHDAFLEHAVMAPKYLPVVAERYFKSEEHRRQFPHQTRWALLNSFTEVLKVVSPGLQLRGHRAVAAALDPARN